MKFYIMILSLLAGSFCFGQSTYPIRADTVKIYKQGGFAELILQNSTKDSTGILVNMGNGVTTFLKSHKINDSTIVIGKDTLKIGSGPEGGGDSSIFLTIYRSDTAKTNLRGSIATKKANSDSLLQVGYVTHSQDDTAKQTLRNSIATKKDKTDSVGLSGYTTIANKNKLADSLAALINGRVANSGGAKFLGSGLYASKPLASTGPGFYYATDSARLYYTDGTAYSAATDRANQVFNLYLKKDGGRGINIGRAADSSFYLKGLVDSGAFHFYLNPDSTITGYVASGGGDGYDSTIMQTIYRSDTAKINIRNSKLGRADSTGNAGFSSIGNRNKLADSLGAVKADKMLHWIDVTAAPYFADSTGVADAGPKINWAIRDAWNTPGNNVVYIPAGKYNCKTLVTTSSTGYNPNASIVIPYQDLRGTRARTVTIMGAHSPSFEKSIVTTGYVPVSSGYTVLLSTAVASGTSPAVIGCEDSIFSGQHWNATEVFLENLIIRTTTKGAGGADTAGVMCGVNLLNLTAISMISVVVDVTSEAFTSVMPNSASTGILLPHANNSAWNYLSRVQVQGYFTGINMNEHTYADYLFIAACDTAIQLDDMNHDIHIDRVLFNGVVHAIHASNNAYIVVDNFDTEHMLTSCRNVWYAFKDDVSSETTSGLWGSIKYHSVRSCGSAHPEDFTVVNKAANLPIPNLAYSYIGQSPLPYQTVIGNGPITTNPVFHQPKYAGLTISSLWGGAAEWMSGYNPDSTNQFYSTGIFNQKTSKTPYYMLGNKYLGNANMIEFKEYMAKADSTMIQVSDRTPFLHAFLQPLKFSPYNTAGRPTSGIVAGAKIYNTDSVANQTHNGIIWETDATREWVRANSSGAYSLPIAGPSTLGGVKINGGGLSIDGTGLLSSTGGTLPPNSGVGFPIYRPQIPEFFGLGCVGCSWDSTSVLHRLTLTVPSVSGFQSVLTNNPVLTTSNYIIGSTKALTFTSFDSIGFTANYYYTNSPFNINAATPTIHFNSSNGSTSYLDVSASGSTGEVADNWPSGGFFRTWKVAGTEKMRMNSAGHLKIGIANNSDSLALLHLGPATAALAQMYLAPTATGPNSTNIKNGFIWRDSVLKVLAYRQGDTTYNLVGFKQIGDSVGSNGYSTNGHLYKLRDSVDALYKRKADSVGSQGYATNGHLNKVADSLSSLAGSATSGNYTPTITGTANVASTTAATCYYLRIGNIVYVSGLAFITATAGSGTVTTFEITLPVASNLSATTDAVGNVTDGTNVGNSGFILPNASTDKAVISYKAQSTGLTNMIFSFMYIVQ